jgi:non-ribosomal peptide synthetase component E (peptide arylation enzyme)
VTLGFDDLIARLKSVGASVFQLPERIEVIEELSMTKVGRVDKKKLREEIKKRSWRGKERYSQWGL